MFKLAAVLELPLCADRTGTRLLMDDYNVEDASRVKVNRAKQILSRLFTISRSRDAHIDRCRLSTFDDAGQESKFRTALLYSEFKWTRGCRSMQLIEDLPAVLCRPFWLSPMFACSSR